MRCPISDLALNEFRGEIGTSSSIRKVDLSYEEGEESKEQDDFTD